MFPLIFFAFILSNFFNLSKKYKYPHDFGGYVEQQYLPNSIKDKVYYIPSDKGYEKKVKEIRQDL